MLFLNTVLITHQVIRFKISSLFTEEKQQLWPQPPFFFPELTLLTIHPFSPTSEMSHISPTVSFQLHFFSFHYFTPLQYIYFSPPFLDFCNLTLPQSGSHASNHLSPLQVFTRAGHFVPELLLKTPTSAAPQ